MAEKIRRATAAGGLRPAPPKPDPVQETREQLARLQAAQNGTSSEFADAAVNHMGSLARPGETLTEPSWTDAKNRMVETAHRVGFGDSLPLQFRQSYGHDIDQGTVEEFRQAAGLMMAAAGE
jgi:hypothetical protein